MIIIRMVKKFLWKDVCHKPLPRSQYKKDFKRVKATEVWKRVIRIDEFKHTYIFGTRRIFLLEETWRKTDLYEILSTLKHVGSAMVFFSCHKFHYLKI